MGKKNISKVARNMLPDYDSAEAVRKDYPFTDRFYTSDSDILRGAQGRDNNWIDPRYYIDLRNSQLICEDELSTANMPTRPIMKSFWTK